MNNATTMTNNAIGDESRVVALGATVKSKRLNFAFHKDRMYRLVPSSIELLRKEFPNVTVFDFTPKQMSLTMARLYSTWGKHEAASA